MAETNGGLSQGQEVQPASKILSRQELVAKKKEEEAAKQKAKENPKDTVTHKKGELRHIGGVMEDPHASGEANATLDQKGETQVNASTRRTYESVVFREYNALQGIVSGDAALQQAVADIKKGVSVPKLGKIAAAQGLTADQLLFYADFTAGAQFAKNKLDSPAAILAQCSLYMSRTDHLITALQISVRQLKMLQESAGADVVPYQIPSGRKTYVEGVFTYDEYGRPAKKGDLYEGRPFFAKLKTFFRPTPDESDIKKQIDGAAREVRKNEELFKKMVSGGVRYLGKDGESITDGHIPLQLPKDNKYARAIVGVGSDLKVGEALHGADDMSRYGQRIHSIIMARVDLYRSFGMDLADIDARVFDISVTAAKTTLTERSNRYGFFDIERSGLALDKQRVRAQEQSVAKTKEAIDKQREEQKKAQREKALGAEKDKWKKELEKQDPDEERREKEEKDRLETEKKLKEKKKNDIDELIKFNTELEALQKQRSDMMTTHGISDESIDEYKGILRSISDFESEIQLLNESIAEIKKQMEGTLDLAKIFGKTKTNADGSSETVPDHQFIESARSLSKEIDTKEKELKNKKEAKRAEEKKRDTILPDTQPGTSSQLMDELIKAKEDIDAKEAQMAASRTALGMAAGVAIPTSTEDLQKEIDSLQSDIDGIGKDRLRERQLEILKTYGEMIASVDAQNERLQQHMVGELADVPDVPHLSGYPRMYLRTLQVLFGEDIVLPGNEDKLAKNSQLFTPDDFVRQANIFHFPQSQYTAFDFRLTDPTPTMLQSQYDAITNGYISAIRKELDDKVIHHTLGGTPEDIRRYEMVKTLQKVKSLKKENDKIALILGKSKTKKRDKMISKLSRMLYHNESPETLAYQLLKYFGKLSMDDKYDQASALYIAQLIIKNRKTNIQM